MLSSRKAGRGSVRSPRERKSVRGWGQWVDGGQKGEWGQKGRHE